MDHLPLLQKIARTQPYPLLFATVSGAHLYGFPSPDSDFDLRGVHILPMSKVVGLREPEETLEVSDKSQGIELDLVTHDIKKFFELSLRRNGYVLEQLFSPLVVLTSPEHEELKKIAEKCLTRYHAHHYLGFAKTQWSLFSKERPPRVKPLLYVYRVLLTGIYLMETGKIECHLENLNEEFKLDFLEPLILAKTQGEEKVRAPKIDIGFHEKQYARLTKQLEDASAGSHLPEAPSALDALDALLIRVRMKYL